MTADGTSEPPSTPSLATTLLDALKGGTVAIADLMRLAGVKRRNVVFNTKLHAVCEAHRRETGRQVVERKGQLVILQRDAAQLHDAIIKSKQSRRKSARAIEIARAVDPAKLDPSNLRRRGRFLDKEESREARDAFTVVHLTDEQAKLLAQGEHVVKREKRPRS